MWPIMGRSRVQYVAKAAKLYYGIVNGERSPSINYDYGAHLVESYYKETG